MKPAFQSTILPCSYIGHPLGLFLPMTACLSFQVLQALDTLKSAGQLYRMSDLLEIFSWFGLFLVKILQI